MLRCSRVQKKRVKEHFVLVGHGTYTPGTATYSQMDYMLKVAGFGNFMWGPSKAIHQLNHVGTTESGKKQRCDTRSLYVCSQRPRQKQYCRRMAGDA